MQRIKILFLALVLTSLVIIKSSAANPTTTTLSVSLNTPRLGQTITLTAAVASPASGNVTFYDGTAVLGIAPVKTGAAAFSTAALASGAHVLQARYDGDASDATSLSGSVRVTVQSAPALNFYALPAFGSTSVSSAITADFNNDHIPDLVTVQQDYSVSVYLGNGDGTFGVATSLAVSAANVTAGDFNGDGNVDLAFTVEQTDTIALFLGVGNGTFTGPTTIAVPGDGNVFAIQSTDFNGDGLVDILVSRYQSVAVLPGNGDATFGSALVSTETSSDIESLVVGDFNGDGRPDLINVSREYGDFFAAGNGDGTFGSGVNLQGIFASFLSAAADFNGDGKLDLLSWGDGYANVVLLGNGDGTFGTAITLDFGYTGVADVNGDGKLDLVSGTNVGYGNGDGTFQPTIVFGPPANLLAVVDVNSNGQVDLISEVSYGSLGLTGITVLLGADVSTVTLVASPNPVTYNSPITLSAKVTPATATGTVTFYDGSTVIGSAPLTSGTASVSISAPYSGRRVYTAQYSGDSVTHFGISPSIEVTVNGTSTATVLLASSATLTYGQPLTLTATVMPVGASGTVTFYDGGAPVGIASVQAGIATLSTATLSTGTHTLTAQYDGGGSYSLSSSVTISVTVMSLAAGDFDNYTSTPGGPSPEGVYSADLNQDGFVDLIVAGQNTFSIALATPSGTFTAPVTYSLTAQPINVLVGDLNNDGSPDLIIQSSMGLTFMLGNGDGTFRAGGSVAALNAMMATGDINRDGRLDLVLAYSSGTVSLLLGNGDGTFQAPLTIDAALGITALAIGDFNRDGNPDLVFCGSSSISGFSGVLEYLGNGDGTFAAPLNSAEILNPVGLALGDLNRDGKLDVVVSTNNSFVSLLGDGAGGFSVAGTHAGDQLLPVLLTDINGDGILDVVGSNHDFLEVFLGMGDGTFSLENTGPYYDDVGSAFAVGDFFRTGRVSIATEYEGNIGLFPGVRPATLSINTSPNPGTLGQPVTISVTILPSDATGTVTFYLGSQSLGTSPVISGVATLTISTLAANRSVVGLSYSGDPITAPEYGYYDVVTITGLPSSLTFSSSSPTITFGHPLTLTASINPVAASGAVTFFAGTQIIGSAPLQNGVAKFSTSSVPAGTFQLRAVYEGNSTYTAGVASSLVPVQVNTVAGSTFTALSSASSLYYTALASGDFNGDGIQDLVVQPDYRSNLQVLLGQGDGTFQLGSDSVPGNFFNSTYFPVVAVDLNGDGKLDLVAPNSFQLMVYLNNGDGTFGQPLNTFFEANAFAATDVNGDGIPDLVLLDPSFYLQVLTGFGDGTFLDLSATFPRGTNNAFAGNLVFADFNGDGKVDLAIGGFDTNSLSIFLGNGDSTFQAPVDIALGTNTGQAVSADLNGDGIPDLAILTGITNNTISVLLGKGDGTFQTPISYSGLDGASAISASDFNGDGKLDIVVINASSTAVFYGNGDGSLQIANVFPQSAPGLFVADYNGDGRADLPTLVGSLKDTITFGSSGSSAGPGQSITLTATVAPAVATGSVTFYDGAIVLGNVPIVNGIATLTIQLPADGLQQITAKYQGDGNYGYVAATAIPVTISGGPGGTFASPVNYPVGTNPSAIVTADFNHDGKLDLAVANANDNSVSVLWGNGDGTFGSTSTFATGTNPISMATGDFNGDGIPDLAVANAGSNNLTILLSSDGSLIPGTTVSLGLSPFAIAAGDVNGDGRVDIVYTGGNVGTSLPLFGNGNGTFTPSLSQPLITSDSGLVLNDFNGDGNIDILLGSYTDYLGDGHGNFQESFFNGPSGTIAASADFNHDGKLDVAFVYYNNAAVSIELGKGDGTFLPAVAYPTPTAPIYLGTGDFNGDGFPDIVLVNSSGTVGLMLGNGDGTFNPEVAFLAGTQPVALAVGDFNGDGRLDLAVPNAGTNNVSVLLGAATGCTFTVAPASFIFDETGGSATVNVTASAPSCPWSANFVQSYNASNTETANGVGNGTFTFFIPSNNAPGGSAASATIDVANQQISVIVRETATQFADVSPSAYYFDAVNLLKQYNITSGCGGDDFCPGDTVTRAQMAIFIVRGILGTDDFSYTLTPYFTDVPSNAFGFQWIQKLRDLNITSGCGTNLFCPNDAVTRSQAAIFLIRARYGVSTVFPYSTVPFFMDVPMNEYAFPWIQRMDEDSITAGCTATTYCPDNPVVRGDMAIFIMRALFNQLLAANEPVIINPSYSGGGSEFLTVSGVNTHFSQSSTQVTVPGLIITGITVTGNTNLYAQATRDLSVPAGPESVVVVTGQEVAVGPNLLNLQ